MDQADPFAEPTDFQVPPSRALISNDDDPFAIDNFGQQEPAMAHGGYVSEPPQVQVSGGADDATRLLAQLVETSQRQEALLGKVCQLLAHLGDRVDRVAASQERLEAKLAQGGGGYAGPVGGQPAAAPNQLRDSRGSLALPPGQPRAPGAPVPGQSVADQQAQIAMLKAQREEEGRMQQLKLEQDRRRLEEEERQRLEEIARKKAMEEQRRKEEAERKRQEELRRQEEERKRKAALEQKTSGLMGNLLSGDSGGGGLFGDEPPKKNKGGLFDD